MAKQKITTDGSAPTHGGKRPGSGRKKGAEKIAVTFRLDKALVKRLKAVVSNSTAFVEEAITEKLDKG